LNDIDAADGCLCFVDRYRSLPSTEHRLQFAELQLELLEDFRVRLLQVRKEMLDSEPSPITPQMCSILNTVSYIDGILQQWNNLPVCAHVARPDTVKPIILAALYFGAWVY